MTPRFLVLAFLLASATPSRAADPGELLAGRSKDCPDCLLAGARLKRFDLSEADLAGANLAGAVSLSPSSMPPILPMPTSPMRKCTAPS